MNRKRSRPLSQNAGCDLAVAAAYASGSPMPHPQQSSARVAATEGEDFNGLPDVDDLQVAAAAASGVLEPAWVVQYLVTGAAPAPVPSGMQSTVAGIQPAQPQPQPPCSSQHTSTDVLDSRARQERSHANALPGASTAEGELSAASAEAQQEAEAEAMDCIEAKDGCAEIVELSLGASADGAPLGLAAASDHSTAVDGETANRAAGNGVARDVLRASCAAPSGSPAGSSAKDVSVTLACEGEHVTVALAVHHVAAAWRLPFPSVAEDGTARRAVQDDGKRHSDSEEEEDEDEDSDASSSSEEEESSSSDESESEEESDTEEATAMQEDEYEGMKTMISAMYDKGEGDEEAGVKDSLRADKELGMLPLQPLDVSIAPEDRLHAAGSVSSVVEGCVVVEGERGRNTLDEGSLLCTSDRQVVGRVEDVFGPVTAPFYVVRYDPKGAVVGSLATGVPLFSVEQYAIYVNQQEMRQPVKGAKVQAEEDFDGCDPEFEFSDDEQEAEFLRARALAAGASGASPSANVQKGRGGRGAGRRGGASGISEDVRVMTLDANAPQRMQGGRKAPYGLRSARGPRGQQYNSPGRGSGQKLAHAGHGNHAPPPHTPTWHSPPGHHPPRAPYPRPPGHPFGPPPPYNSAFQQHLQPPFGTPPATGLHMHPQAYNQPFLGGPPHPFPAANQGAFLPHQNGGYPQQQPPGALPTGGQQGYPPYWN